MRLEVNHRTTYHFDPVMRGVAQSLRLWPSLFEGQTVLNWFVDVAGAHRGTQFRDGAGDYIETATLLGDVDRVDITVQGVVETTDLSGVLRGHREKIPPMAYLRTGAFTKADGAIRELASAAVKGADSSLAAAHALANAIGNAIQYVSGETDSKTTAAEALEKGRGVCQDHAHALIAAALSQDMPARYVTGYLHAEGDIAEASHAWAEIHVADLGWVGFDASNGVCPDERYIRLGSGYDAVDAAPIRGVAQGAGAETLDVDVSVVEATQ